MRPLWFVQRLRLVNQALSCQTQMTQTDKVNPNAKNSFVNCVMICQLMFVFSCHVIDSSMPHKRVLTSHQGNKVILSRKTLIEKMMGLFADVMMWFYALDWLY